MSKYLYGEYDAGCLGINIINWLCTRERARDVSVISQTAFETTIEPGTQVEIEVKLENLGSVTESFDVTCFYDDRPIGTERVEDLPAGDSTIVTFTWDTSGVPLNEYSIKAWADSGEEIQEADEENNWCLMQLPIFVIPEFPLGTLMALISTLVALLFKNSRENMV